jgi:hypothetical protein
MSARLAKVADRKTTPLVLASTPCRKFPGLLEPDELCASSIITLVSSAMAFRNTGFSGFLSGELNCEYVHQIKSNGAGTF